ncbi:hypothetical protein CAOG_07879 [Capsaspora owczarzaki ATCC 30864]|uniref:BHLH domain-containing protein n=1 Tax=Capsaspora owczarzaki (strain ATCC 30864) TaxID=595528 RepID=A0A0D2X5G7_CAPO3|nr:hypothetical protein CAOG_07879 [Capsaspora owczarzaki ATCC 30864]KJE97779.1 hypothetical protein CAOG_007879 [Capsaspora owczarzaki ATCC 30864]|eukprot:XP_004342964.1 hypothetical protein CAOG_07879 [Capsaspora owczarzaki ATCC 30864]
MSAAVLLLEAAKILAASKQDGSGSGSSDEEPNNHSSGNNNGNNGSQPTTSAATAAAAVAGANTGMTAIAPVTGMAGMAPLNGSQQQQEAYNLPGQPPQPLRPPPHPAMPGSNTMQTTAMMMPPPPPLLPAQFARSAVPLFDPYLHRKQQQLQQPQLPYDAAHALLPPPLQHDQYAGLGGMTGTRVRASASFSGFGSTANYNPNGPSAPDLNNSGGARGIMVSGAGGAFPRMSPNELGGKRSRAASMSAGDSPASGGGFSPASSIGGGGSSTSGTQWVKNRETHNLLEKNRRAHLKDCFTALKDAIPEIANNPKTSTVAILQHAQNFIVKLQFMTDSVVANINAFQQHNQQAMALLQQHMSAEEYEQVVRHVASMAPDGPASTPAAGRGASNGRIAAKRSATATFSGSDSDEDKPEHVARKARQSHAGRVGGAAKPSNGRGGVAKDPTRAVVGDLMINPHQFALTTSTMTSKHQMDRSLANRRRRTQSFAADTTLSRQRERSVQLRAPSPAPSENSEAPSSPSSPLSTSFNVDIEGSSESEDSPQSTSEAGDAEQVRKKPRRLEA